jgi:glycyl-tRNA synthetase
MDEPSDQPADQPGEPRDAAEGDAGGGGAAVTMETIVNLCKRRGLVFPSSEIYGGFRSTWDYGPLGVELKRNVKDAWWKAMVHRRDDVVGLDAAILMAPKVWEASGHLATFSDPLVDCRNCKQRFRADHIDLSAPCPNCGKRDTFTEGRPFNLMFKTFVGPVEDDASVAYLRPETAQGIFVNYVNVQTTARRKPPFGIAQVGKSFRNEITPGNFTYRTREFEQMEMEYFVPPDQAQEWFAYWCQARLDWYRDLGIQADHLRLRPHEQDELSHYSAQTSDVEFLYPWGWGELEGVANRGDFDLTQHAKFSGQELSYFDQETGTRYVPHVIEPAAGADRATLAFLLDAYREEVVNDETRVVLGLDPRLAPVKVAVLPLSKKDTLTPVAREVHDVVRQRWVADYDESQGIGKRYRRQDEVGTPLCVTVDFETLDDRAVTVRQRDSMAQERVSIDRLVGYLGEHLAGV